MAHTCWSSLVSLVHKAVKCLDVSHTSEQSGCYRLYSFAALRQIRNVRRCLPQHALLTLIRALVVSKADYICSVLAGVFGHLLDRLQSILNAVARLVFSARRSERFSATFTGCGSRNGYNYVSAFWHSEVSTDQHRHISLRTFVGQPMRKVVATSAHLPP